MEISELDTALILAGGKSLRYGRDKAFIQTREGILIESIISQLKEAFSRILIIANDRESYQSLGLPVIPDILENTGPLGGVHAGLRAAGRPAVFITACDMPRISLPVVSHMKELFCRNSPEAVIAAHNGFIEPFHAFYAGTLSESIESFITRDVTGSLHSFLKGCRCQMVEEEILDKLCPDRSLFWNINKPEDLLKIEGEAG